MTNRAALVRRGLALNWITLSYNVVEAVGALLARTMAGSVALVGFGVDSVIEVTASGVAQWRLRADVGPHRRERVERTSHRVIGVTVLALAALPARGLGGRWTTDVWRPLEGRVANLGVRVDIE